jgi:hypothetical protein
VVQKTSILQLSYEEGGQEMQAFIEHLLCAGTGLSSRTMKSVLSLQAKTPARGGAGIHECPCHRPVPGGSPTVGAVL